MFSVPFGEGDGGSVKDGEASRLFEVGESRKCGANFPVVTCQLIQAKSPHVMRTLQKHMHTRTISDGAMRRQRCGSVGGMQTDHHERVNAVETKRSGVVDISLKHGDM